VSFGIALECAKPVISERFRRIHSGERGRVLAASFYIELIIETCFVKVSLLVGHPIVKPAMRLNDKFRHNVFSRLQMLLQHSTALQIPRSKFPQGNLQKRRERLKVKTAIE
jgi:hypothetical protein